MFKPATAALALLLAMSAPALAQQAAPANTATPQPGNPQEEASPSPEQAGAGEAAGAPGTPIAFPQAQVRKGTPLYADNCASCHGDRLQGLLEAPALAGADFQGHWFGQPASNLYEYISLYMPQDRPGALTPEDYAAITTFILSKNGLKGSNGVPDLPGDVAALTTVTLPAPAAQ